LTNKVDRVATKQRIPAGVIGDGSRESPCDPHL
jgi:hypothetical protein